MQVEPNGVTTSDWIGWIFSILTLIVILVYTWQTRKMQRAVTKQAEAANRQTELLADQIQVSHRQLEEMASQSKTYRDQAEQGIHQTKLLADQINVSHRQLEEMAAQSKIYQTQADELIHQTRLSFMPAFIAVIDWPDGEPPSETWDSGNRLMLTNVGRGVALNLKVDNVSIAPDEVVFDPVPFVRPDEKVTVRASKASEQEQNIFFDALEDIDDKVFQMRISFDDVEGNRYEQIISTANGGCWPGPVTPARLQEF
jgi:hypothetical protein